MNSNAKAALILLIFTTIIFCNFFFSQEGHFLLGGDVIRYTMGRYELFSKSLQQFKIPTWDPYALGGTPFYGDTVMMLFYLPMWPYFITSNWGYFGLLAFIQVFFAGFFMFLLTRRVGLSHNGSLISAVIYMFSGQVLCNAFEGQFQALGNLTSFPLIILLTIKLFRDDNKILYSALLGLTMSLTFFAGHLQYLYYTVIALAIYLVFELFYNKNGKKTILAVVRYILFSMVIFLLVSFVQLCPFFSYQQNVGNGLRGSYSFATEGSVHPLLFVRFLYPNLYGDVHHYFFYTYYGDNPYASIFGLLCALIFCIAIAKRKKLNFFEKYFIFLFILALFLMLGAYNPLYYIFFKFVPGISSVRLPSRFMFFSTTSISVLSGFSYDRLFVKRDKFWNKKLVGLLKLVVIVSFLALISLGAAYFFKDKLSTFLFSKYSAVTSTKTIVSIKPEFIIKQLNYLLKINLTYISFTLMLTFALLLFSKKIYRYTGTMVILIVFLDLILMLPLPSFGSFEKTFSPNPIEQYLISQNKGLGNYRITEIEPWGKMEMLTDYVSHKYKLEGASWSGSSTPPANFYNFIIPLYKGNISTEENIRRLKLLNVKYLISVETINNKEFNLKLTYNNSRLYELTDVGPRVIILNGTGKVETTHYEETNIVVKLHNDRNSTIFFSELFYPLWQAKVNGKIVTIQKCYGSFRCINVQKGDNEIQMSFVPRMLILNLLLSGFSFLSVLTIVCFGLRKTTQGYSRKP